MNIDNKKTKTLFITIIFIGLVLLIVLNFKYVLKALNTFYTIMEPLLLGAIIAFVLNILVVFYEKVYFTKSKSKLVEKSRRGVCILLSILTIILILVFFLNIVIPQVSKFISLLIKEFPGVYDKLVKWAIEYADEIPALQESVNDLNMNGEQVLKKGLEILRNWTFGTVSLIGSAFGIIFQLVLTITFSIYILIGKEDLKYKFDKLFRAYIKDDKRKKLYEALKIADETFASYIIGQCKEAVILGVLCTLGMVIFRFPYAKVVGPVIGMTALIPMLGAYIGAGLG